MKNFKKEPRGIETPFDIQDVRMRMFHLMKIMKGAERRLYTVSEFAYQSFKDGSMEKMKLFKKNEIESAILEEKSTIKKCKLELKTYEN